MRPEAATGIACVSDASPVSLGPLKLHLGLRGARERESRALVGARVPGTAVPGRDSHCVAEERPEPPRASSAEVGLAASW